MRSVDVRIGHDDDLVIAKFGNIEIVSVSFGEAAAERIDHGLDLCIGKNLVDTCFLDVQDFASDR